MCQGNILILSRTTPSSLKLKSCLNNLKKSGLRYSITSTPLSTSSSLIKWSSSPWMVSLQDRKWTPNDPEGSRVPETINNLSSDFTATMSKALIVNKISRTIRFLLVLSLCKNWMKWFTFLFRKRLKKMITGKMLVSFLQDLTLREKVNTRSCNGSEQTSINLRLMIAIVSTEPMLI